MSDISELNKISSTQPSSTATTKQVVELRPKIGFPLAAYILFSLPGFFSGILWFFITIMLFFGIMAGANAADQNTPKLNLDKITSGTNSAGILVYDLKGAISTGNNNMPENSREMGIYTEVVAKDFKLIKENRDIKNVVFRVNSPGGEIFASHVLGDMIQDLMKHFGQNEAIYYFDQVAASGALLASYKNPNYIVASEYGETGSIGVMMEIANVKNLSEKIGYKQVVIKSSNQKDLKNPFRDMTEAEEKYLQGQINREYENFKKIVQNGRKIEDQKIAEVATGLVFDNKQAKEMKLVDEVGSINIAYNKAAKNANLPENSFNIWRIKSEFGVFENIFGSKSVSQTLGLPTNTIQKLDRQNIIQTGKIYAIDEYKI